MEKTTAAETPKGRDGANLKPEHPELVSLHFLTSMPPFRAGEIAGLEPAIAKEYVARKIARQVDREEADRIHAANTPSPLSEPETFVVLRFERPHPPFRAGEIAGFSPEEAERIVKRKVDGQPVATFVREAPQGPTGIEVPDKPAKGPGGARTEPPHPELVSVRFLKAVPGYLKGETAGFPVDVAEELVKAGSAVAPEDWPGDDEPATGQAAAGGDPPAGSVDPNAEVLGLDDRDPEWREKQGAAAATDGPPADKMVKRPPAAKKPTAKKGKA